MALLSRLTVVGVLVILVGCGNGGAPTAESPAPGPTPVPGPTGTPSPTPGQGDGRADALIACLQESGLQAEPGPIGDFQEQFQVGVGTHEQFRFQAVVLGYEDERTARRDKRQVERGGEQIGADLPEIRQAGRALIFVLDPDISQSDLGVIEDCARTTV